MKMLRALSDRMGVAGDLLSFFWQRKLWWLMPMLLLLLGFAILIGLAQTSAIAPFIYTLF